MKAGHTITQDDINKKLFEELEKMGERNEQFQKEMKEDSVQFRKDIREDMKQFQANINSQMRWNLIIFLSVSAGVLYKLLSIPTP
jgi:DNA modification methylase